MDNQNDRVGDIIEELKRLQVEYNNVRVRKSDNHQLKFTWPQAKDVNGETVIVF